MPENTPRPPRNQPWENGWAPDTSRTPGTRRLWLAGVLALATVITCVMAIAFMKKASDGPSHAARSPAPSASTATEPGLITFASPSDTGASAPGGKVGQSTARTTPAAPASASPAGGAKPSKSPTHKATSSSKPKPTGTWKSVRSVNYPDRYWHVSGDYVKLDPITSAAARKDATFKLVKGLAKADCYSFATADGTYLRHRDFVLRAERNDGSALFKQDATFCRRASSITGAIMLESVNYPGRYLRHQNFQLVLDSEYGHQRSSSQYQADSAFLLVDGLA
ncbi:AbfB domain-containing protein [Streptomyces sp. NPDC092369]|uniref:AbfB domain-containing protein n=1 Tax=Streptomyces sp. NPDC092369 TaxID=3366015 RepID=UPI00382BDD79